MLSNEFKWDTLTHNQNFVLLSFGLSLLRKPQWFNFLKLF